jgi:hypothetical protein
MLTIVFDNEQMNHASKIVVILDKLDTKPLKIFLNQNQSANEL